MLFLHTLHLYIALLIKLSVLNISSANATALCTFSSGLEIDTFRCLVVCAPSPASSGSHGQRSSLSDSLQAGTTETVAPLTELAANTQYACDAVAVSSGIWSLEQHQVTAVFRTHKREHNCIVYEFSIIK